MAIRGKVELYPQESHLQVEKKTEKNRKDVFRCVLGCYLGARGIRQDP